MICLRFWSSVAFRLGNMLTINRECHSCIPLKSAFQQHLCWHLCCAIITDRTFTCLRLWGCCDGWAAVLCHNRKAGRLFGFMPSVSGVLAKASAASPVPSYKPKLSKRSPRDLFKQTLKLLIHSRRRSRKTPNPLCERHNKSLKFVRKTNHAIGV